MFVYRPHSFEDQRFDEVIGHIQDIIIGKCVCVMNYQPIQ